jgi:hypothetical protein
MPYARIDHQHITDRSLAKVFHHADMLLSDLYSVFHYDPPLRATGAAATSRLPCAPVHHRWSTSGGVSDHIARQGPREALQASHPRSATMK